MNDKFKKSLVGIAAAASLATGGGFAVDQSIDPYVSKADVYEMEKVSVIKDAGTVETRLSKDEPAVTLSRWNGRGEITIKYEDLAGAKGSRPLFSNTVEWKGSKEELHAYPLEASAGMEDGGFEIEVILNEKPDTDTWAFKIDGWQNVDFFYQPELTEEDIESGIIRPENVVGSYAVYHKEKKDHVKGGTNYATGKLFHIYRPKAIDANGVEQWSELSYDDAGSLSVKVPQEFLDKATYPVRVDPTIGYTTGGASSVQIGRNQSGTIRDGIVGTGINNAALTEYTTMSFYVNFMSPTTTSYQTMWYASTSEPYPIDASLTSAEATINSIGWKDIPISLSVPSGDWYFVMKGDGNDFLNGQSAGLGFDSNTAHNRITHPSGGEVGAAQGVTIYDELDVSGGVGCTTTCETISNPLTTTGRVSMYVTTNDAPIVRNDVYASAGSFTWTAPTGVTSVQVACWAGGGGGGDSTNAGGGGGGGGAFASSTGVSVTPGDDYTVVVGAQGTAAGSQGPGGDGGDSSFGGTLVVADGGTGGGGVSSATASGGAGGTTANSTGDVEFAGGAGGAGNNTGDTSGGGGGGAGPQGAGGAGAGGGASTVGGGGGGGNGGGNASGATGGTSTFGGAGGNGGNGSDGTNGTDNIKGGGGAGGGDDGFQGRNAGSVGGGGAGGENTGGIGGAGRCELTYTIPAADVGGDRRIIITQ